MQVVPFFLADKAVKWVKSLAPGSLTTWEETETAFLDTSLLNRGPYMRSKIGCFQQNGSKSFHEAW